MTDTFSAAPQPASADQSVVHRLGEFGVGRLFWRVREPVIIADAASGQIVAWNPGAEELFGYSVDEAVGQLVELIVPHRLRSPHRAGIARYQEAGHGQYIDSSVPLELPALCKNGDEITIELTLSAIEDAAVPGRYVLALVRDLTERKRAEAERGEQIRQEESRRQAEAAAVRFESLVEHASDITVVVGPAGDLRYATPSVSRLLGYTVSGQVGMNVATLVHPEDLPGFRDALDATLARTGYQPLLAMRVRHADGSWRMVEYSANNLLDDPRVAGIVFNVRDVTERNRAKEAELAAEAKYRGIVDNALEGIYQVMLDGSTRTVNPAMARMLGYDSPDDLLSSVSTMRLLFVDAEVRNEFFGRLEADGQVKDFQFRGRCKDGDVTWLTMNARAHFAPDGALAGVDGLLVDITERKRAEQRLQLLAEASNVLGSSLDYEATLQQLVRLVTPALADWGAVDMLEPDGSFRRLAVCHTDPAKEALLWRLGREYLTDPRMTAGPARALRTGEPQFAPLITPAVLAAFTVDPEHLRLLQEAGTSSMITMPLMARERPLGAILLTYGESGRRYGEEDLKLVAELARRAAMAIENARLYQEAQTALAAAQSALATREDFLSLASHELRTPLTALMGQVQLTARRLRRGDIEQAANLISRAEEQIGRMAGLVGDLLDVSRITSGRFQAEREPVALGPLLERALASARHSAPERVITVTLPASLPALDADAPRLEQVLGILLENARVYSAPDSPVELSVSTKGDDVCIAVRDHGIGIPPAEHEQIFNRFHRATNINPNIAGLGLGLFISRQIIQAHGGTLTVTSTPGEGSTFTITLPSLHSLREG